MKIGDPVSIIPFIKLLQPSNVDHKTCGQYGRVVSIDGCYVMVKPKYKRWEIECYDTELNIMTNEEYKKVKNYARE